MCNACGFLCCAWDGFEKCGCDGCPEPACWDDEGEDDDNFDYDQDWIERHEEDRRAPSGDREGR